MSLNADNVKTNNGTFSLTIIAADISIYGQEVFISVSITPENSELLDFISYFDVNFLLCNHILQKQSSQFHKVILSDFCNFSMFLKSCKHFSGL